VEAWRRTDSLQDQETGKEAKAQEMSRRVIDKDKYKEEYGFTVQLAVSVSPMYILF
jgi:hypothetical protein